MKETTAKKKFMWNMAGSLCNSLSSMLLLIIVNRISGESRGGFFALAYSTAQLLFSVGGFEIRPVQSTDIKNKFTFDQYFTSRMLNCCEWLYWSRSTYRVLDSGVSNGRGCGRCI